MDNFKGLFDQIACDLMAMFNVNIDGNAFIGNSHQYKIRDDYARAVQCADHDPSYLTSLMILENTFHKLLANISFPLSTILNPDEDLSSKLDFASKINRLLNEDMYRDQKAYFIDTVSKGIKHYGADHDVKDSDIFDIRFKAINSFHLLKKNQFLTGEYSLEESQYIKQIYEWWNINSLLNFALSLPNSISLHVIRHPNLFESYFCILIKNGSNIYTLTDGLETPNPLYMQRSRRPDNIMAKSIDKHLFPYYLLNLETSLGDLYTYDEEQTTGIVPFQKETHIVSSFDKLEAENLIWIILLFDLIHQNYFLTQIQHPALSYTNEMLRNPKDYVALAHNHGLAVINSQVCFDEITVESLHTDNIDSSALGCDVTTTWMEERYASKINPELLNVYGKIEDDFSYTIETNELTAKKHDPSICNRKSTTLSIKSVISSDFGTEEQLRKDRIFIARHNYAKLIEKMAITEFNEQGPEIIKWFKKLCESNSDRILQKCVETAELYDYKSSEVKHKRQAIENLSGLGYMNGFPTITNLGVMGLRGNVLKISNFYPVFTMGYAKSLAYGADLNLCCITKTMATYEFGFKMRDSKMIQEFFEISEKQMPEMLRKFTTQKSFGRTNSNLNRVDPMADIVNPFSNLALTVLVRLSVKGLKQLIENYKV